MIKFFITALAIFWFTACDDPTALKSFSSVDRKFQAVISDGNNDPLGQHHGITPQWEVLCGLPAGNDNYMTKVIEKLTLEFSKDSDKAKIILDCNRLKAGTTKAYEFTYTATAVGDNLLLTLKAQIEVPGKVFNKSANLLDFFNKADWFYEKDKITGISQFENIFGASTHRIPLKTKAEFDNAISYLKSGSKFEIAQGISAVAFVLTPMK